MKKLLVAIFLLISVMAFAKPVLYTVSAESGVTDVVLETTRNITYIEIYAPDEDVTVSLWRNNGDETFTLMYPKTPSGCDDCEDTYTVYSGVPYKFNGVQSVDKILVERSSATKVGVTAR